MLIPIVMQATIDTSDIVCAWLSTVYVIACRGLYVSVSVATWGAVLSMRAADWWPRTPLRAQLFALA